MLLGLLVDHRCGNQIDCGQEAGNPVRWGRADAEPILDPLLIEVEAFRVILGNHRVVGADTLNEAAITRTARIGNNDTVVRAFFCPTAGQSDFQ